MIIDVHTHFSGVPGTTPDERIAHLMEYADRIGIDHVCLYMGLAWSRYPKPADFRRDNDHVLEALKHWGQRAFGFVYLNAQYVDESLAELDRCVRDGPMVGVKLWVARRCGEEQIDPIIRRATELKAVIFQHTWFKTDGTMYSGESSPENLVELAKRHPGVPLICGHTGGVWELGIRAVRSLKSISIDLAGSDPTNGFVEMAVRELGPERILYGSDAGGRSFSSQLAKVYGANLPDETRRLILAGNLRRMLTPILKAKGMKV